MGTVKTQPIRLDLTQFKCPRALIELKLNLSSLEKGERLTVMLNIEHDNQDIFRFLDLDIAGAVVDVIKHEAMTHTLTLIKS